MNWIPELDALNKTSASPRSSRYVNGASAGNSIAIRHPNSRISRDDLSNYTARAFRQTPGSSLLIMTNN